MKQRVLFSFGTRPEAIKLAPVIRALASDSENFSITICLTSQHKDLLRQVTDFFHITEDVDLDVMVKEQTLEHITSAVLERMRPVMERYTPDVVLVQGDTTTVFASALSAFYHHVRVGHVEAGLRTHDKYSPFPEEINRRLTSPLADYHFAPTDGAAENLRREGISESLVHVTGNTVVDALLLGLSILDSWPEDRRVSLMTEAGVPTTIATDIIEGRKRLITVTAHRRESFGAPFEQMCLALRDIVEKYSDLVIVYPVHPNPNVRAVVNRVLADHSRIVLIEPARYEQLLQLMRMSVLLLTDSGGIQEEGPSLRKPVLVMREVTERPEGIEAGVARLVGTDRHRIVATVSELLEDEAVYSSMSTGRNPYGDGEASKRIRKILLQG